MVRILLKSWCLCFILSISLTSCTKQASTVLQVQVTTLAGNGKKGFVDGPVATAQFNNPSGVVVDPAGVVYVADEDNHSIRKITPDGYVMTLAGTGKHGYANGQGSVARFRQPFGLAIDGSGNIYVADQSNQCIRKITSSGEVETIAGGRKGFADGSTEKAMFNFPSGVAVGQGGNLYIADQFNNRIRVISASGDVSTLAGGKTEGFVDGSGEMAMFGYPVSLATDLSGNIYVADQKNHSIRRVTPTGVVSTVAGNGTPGYVDGPTGVALFRTPASVALDALGNTYVADAMNHRIRKISVDKQVSTLAGYEIPGFADGPGDQARFFTPVGIAVDRSGKNIYVADRGNQRIRKISLISTTK